MDFSKTLLFDGITNDEGCRMMTCFGATFERYKAAEVVRDYCKKDGHLGVLMSGSAYMMRTDANGNETVLEMYREGDIFGEVIAFSNVRGDSVKVVSDSDCVVMFLAYSQITKRCPNACEHHSRLVANLFRMIAKKTYLLSQRIEILSQRTTRDKLLYYFEILRKESGDTFYLPMSLTRLAEFICADRSAMMRELNRLKEDGIIITDKKKVTMIS